jgi:hypothetical protein
LWFWLLRVRVPSVTRPARWRGKSQNPVPKAYRIPPWDLGFGAWDFRREAAVVRLLLKHRFMLNPAVIDSPKAHHAASNFWMHLLNNEDLQNFDDLEKLVVGCEIIAALDAVDLLAA